MQRKIELNIGELVLKGIGRVRTDDLRAACERELGLVLATNVVVQRLSQRRDNRQLAGGKLTPAETANDRAIGSGVARGVGAAITKW
ncbi:MAG: hypothetical protein ACLQBA_09485 [Candidatus Binataceae bacterium]